MTTQTNPQSTDDETSPDPSSSVGDFLALQRVSIGHSVSSRKRLLEHIAAILCVENEELSSDVVFKTLTDRERLGSTGLGHGIAIPHGRIAGLEQPTVAVVRLASPIDFDSPDGQPVWLAVSLLVPDDACAEHLNLLAGLASLFNQSSFVDSIKNCSDEAEVYERFTHP